MSIYVVVLLTLAAMMTSCASDSTPTIPAAALRSFDDQDLWVVGALHVHSSYSDGTGDLDSISESAANAGLDFWVLTDHQRMDALSNEGEGYDRGVLRLVGVEASTEAGHLLGLNLPESPLQFGKTPENVLREVAQLGGFAIAAHPNATREEFGWTGWDLRGFSGIELFSAYSAWSRRGSVPSLAYMLIDPYWQTPAFNWSLDLDPDLVAMWDRQLQHRKLAGWAGVDAHGGIGFPGRLTLPWPSYDRLFRIARNYLLLDEPLNGEVVHDRRLIYAALLAGRGYFALNDRDEASTFRYWAERGTQTWAVGSDIPFSGPDAPTILRASIEDEANVDLRLLLDGQIVAESMGGQLRFEARQNGIYRVEVRVDERRIGGRAQSIPWIVSNPISILPGNAGAGRIAANQIVDEALASNSTAVSDQPLLNFVVSPGPRCESVNLEMSGSGEGTLQIAFELGELDAATPYGICAVGDGDIHDFSDHVGIRFRTRADAIYRGNIQLHDRPVNRPIEETEFWSASYLIGPEWQEVVIPFDRFRNTVPASAAALNLSNVTGPFFIFDTANTRPGTSGVVEIENVSFVPLCCEP